MSRTAPCVSFSYLSHFVFLVRPVFSPLCSVLLMTVVFLGVVRPSCLISGAGGVVIASVVDEVERAAAGSSTVVEGEDSASESLSLVTRSVVESVLDVGTAAVQLSVEQVSSVAVAGSPSVAVDALGPEVERLSVASLSPGPVDICVETAATVVDGSVFVAAGPVDVTVQTDGGLYVLYEILDHVKYCVFCKIFSWLWFIFFFLCLSVRTDAFLSLVRDLLQQRLVFFMIYISPR